MEKLFHPFPFSLDNGEKMNFIKIILITVAVLGASESFAQVVGDTQGKVSHISLHAALNDTHTLRIYFSNIENDRWGCIASPGYVQVSDSNPSVTKEQLQMILSMAMSAQISSHSFAIDSGGTDPCNSGNMAWLF